MKTKEEVLEIYDSLSFFHYESLNPIREKLEEVTSCPEYKIPNMMNKEGYTPSPVFKRFLEEMEVVNKLLTIENIRDWEETCKRPYYKEHFKNIITNSKSKSNEFTGIIDFYGSKMSNEELELYNEIYDELFERI